MIGLNRRRERSALPVGLLGASWSHVDLLLIGLAGTVKIAVISIVLGVLVGMVLALMRLSANGWLHIPATAFVEFYRNTPPIVHFFWFFYALPIVIGLNLDPYRGGGAGVVDAVGRVLCRGVPRRHRLDRTRPVGGGARAGHDAPQAMLRGSIVPQALRRMVAPFVERSFELTKTTALASTLAYAELLYQAQQVNSITFRPMEVYTTIAVMYFLLLFAASSLARIGERRLTRIG